MTVALRALGASPSPWRDRKAHRLGHAKTAAVLAEALHIQHLIERQLHTLTLQSVVPLGPPCTENGERSLGHRLGVEHLQVMDGHGPRKVQNRGGQRRKGQLPFHRDQLIQHGGAADAFQRGQPLLDAAVRQGRDDLGFQLGVDRRHQPEGSPHLYTAGRDRTAVQIFRLPFHLRRPCREGELRQLQHLIEGQLLLGLAKARILLALIINDAAQITLQRQLAGLQLLLQHHRLRKAFDQLEHRRQIIGNQNFCFQRELRFDGAVCPRRRQRVPKDLQFHPVRSFPVRLA